MERASNNNIASEAEAEVYGNDLRSVYESRNKLSNVKPPWMALFFLQWMNKLMSGRNTTRVLCHTSEKAEDENENQRDNANRNITT